jgi:hypothetical protein
VVHSNLVRAAWLALTLVLLGACQQETLAPSLPGVGAVRLLVEETGVYQVTAGELRRAGLTAELRSDSLMLSREGEPVPYVLHDGALVFYGEAPHSRYTDSQAYILEAGRQGVTMTARPSLPNGPVLDAVQRTLVIEKNWEYVANARGEGLDEPWFWQSLPLEGRLTIPVTVPQPANGVGELQLVLYGASYHQTEAPDHTLAVAVNGTQSQAFSWDGQTVYTATLSLASGTLVDGENTLILENLPQDYLDVIMLDLLRLDYEALPKATSDRLAFSAAPGQIRVTGFSHAPLLLNVTDPRAPVVLKGEETGDGALLALDEAVTVVATGPQGYRQVKGISAVRDAGWREPEHQADLVVITTEELAPALERLVTAREAQGLRVAAVIVEDIFDEFGAGMATPDSIRTFLAYTQSDWAEPHPRYVLLAGEATTDFRGDLASRPQNPVLRPRNLIPPYLVPVGFSGETVSDARLADVDGDLQPDIAIGRWPVDDAASLSALVDRTLAYEAAAAPDLALFASDGSSAEFSNLTGRILEATAFPPSGVQLLNGPTGADMISAWNEGAWLITYAGHGSLQLWGKDSIFSSESIPVLSEASAAPIVLQLTCLTGLFAHPEIVSLSERLLLQDGGPVLTVAATSLTLSAHQEPFAAAFLRALQDPAVERIGDAFQEAKRSLDISNNGLREISDTFSLIGDPSARIVRP